MRALPLAAILILAGCTRSHSSLGGSPTDSTTDSPVVDSAPDPVDTVPDTVVDLPCYNAPPCPDGPEDGVMGRSCRMNEECSDVPGAWCMTERFMEYDGEWYVQNPGGACVFVTDDDFCDPRDDDGCPAGSHCLMLGEYMGWEFFGCMDACSPGDASGERYDWACGCRRGYRCDPSMYLCVSGCTNDRECCERWVDENEDGQRDEGEVTFFEGCESYCDGDDEDENADCMASWSCINPGSPDASIGGPCEHDSQCPPDGECLSFTDPETGEDFFPGGYCSRAGCQLVGLGCEDSGGWCLNMGSLERPAGRCFRPCVVGLDLSDPEYGCRTTVGQEQACRPIPPIGWIGGAPPGGEDGFCFPGNFPGGSSALGEACETDQECLSPRGLGGCNDWFDSRFCTVGCNEDLATGEGICGGVDAEGLATGLCGWSTCWPGCSGLASPPGSNGCARPGFACVALSLLESSIYVVGGALKPPGFCMPACTSDTFCKETFGDGYACDPVTGACG